MLKIVEMQAVLWDGYKQIKGNLNIEGDTLHFHLEDFKNTNLHLHIPLSKIAKVSIQKLYDIQHSCIAIHSDIDKVSVFKVEDVHVAKSWIESNMKWDP